MTITEKECRACGEVKPLEAFHRNPYGRGGRETQCAECRSKAQRAARDRNRDVFRERWRRSKRQGYWRDPHAANQYRNRYPRWWDTVKEDARNQLRKAVKRGDVVKPEHCEQCGVRPAAPQLHGHHPDYSRPLDVIWLCPSCHGAAHRADAETLHPQQEPSDG